MGLALLGLGAGAPAAAEDAGDLAGWNHGSAVPELDQRQCPECLANSPAGSNARMRLDPDPGVPGAETLDGGPLRIEGVPISVVTALFPLRAQHDARLCKPHRHLCDLIAEHMRTSVDRAALKRTRAPELTLRK